MGFLANPIFINVVPRVFWWAEILLTDVIKFISLSFNDSL